ncbi:MAG: rod shape-determining protein MreD [Mariniphaga sp.]
MVINLFKYSLIFVVSVLLQVLIFNNILIARVIAPFFYILFIILLPFDTPRSLLLFLSFILGLTVDIFTNTPGVHASACLLSGFIRPGILGLISSRETLESVIAPRVRNMGFQWFAGYTAFMVIIHHLFLFFIEAFTFDGFLITLLRVLLSSVLSIGLIVLSQFIIFRK